MHWVAVGGLIAAELDGGCWGAGRSCWWPVVLAALGNHTWPAGLLNSVKAKVDDLVKCDLAASTARWRQWAQESVQGGGKLAHRFAQIRPLELPITDPQGLGLVGTVVLEQVQSEWLPYWVAARRQGSNPCDWQVE